MRSRSRSKSITRCVYGVRKSGPTVKSGPRKGLRHCYKSKSQARRARSISRSKSGSKSRSKSRSRAYTSTSPCVPHPNETVCLADDRCTWQGKRKCIRKPTNQFPEYYQLQRSHQLPQTIQVMPGSPQQPQTIQVTPEIPEAVKVEQYYYSEYEKILTDLLQKVNAGRFRSFKIPDQLMAKRAEIYEIASKDHYKKLFPFAFEIPDNIRRLMDELKEKTRIATDEMIDFHKKNPKSWWARGGGFSTQQPCDAYNAKIADYVNKINSGYLNTFTTVDALMKEINTKFKPMVSDSEFKRHCGEKTRFPQFQAFLDTATDEVNQAVEIRKAQIERIQASRESNENKQATYREGFLNFLQAWGALIMYPYYEE